MCLLHMCLAYNQKKFPSVCSPSLWVFKIVGQSGVSRVGFCGFIHITQKLLFKKNILFAHDEIGIPVRDM